MLDSPAIDVSIGLILCYLMLSLFASAVQEWIASLFALRSKNLRKGIGNLISKEYAERFYDHPLIKKLAKSGKLPSYIAPRTMSTVLLEVVAKDKGDRTFLASGAKDLRALINSVPESHPLRSVLDSFYDDSAEAAQVLQERLSDWFDEGMDRISGWYKRRVKLTIFGIAAMVTVATNASSIHIAQELWRHEALRTALVARAEAVQEGSLTNADGQLDSLVADLDSLPIGWKTTQDGSGSIDWPEGFLGWLALLFGWAITVAAVSLGAPFWFDLLGKVTNLRGTGGKVREAAPARSQ